MSVQFVHVIVSFLCQSPRDQSATLFAHMGVLELSISVSTNHVCLWSV